MLFPSKITSFNESALQGLLFVAQKISRRQMSVMELVQECRCAPLLVADVLSALDMLYALRKIELKKGELTYVK